MDKQNAQIWLCYNGESQTFSHSIDYNIGTIWLNFLFDLKPGNLYLVEYLVL